MNLQNKLREQLAQTFLDALKQEQLPWKACWQVALPANAATGKQYKGINALMLSYVSAQAGFKDHRWCTFRQADAKGWHIQKGAKATPIEYWAYFDREKRKLLSWTEARKVIRENPDYAAEQLVLRSRVYSVFNGEQMEGIPPMEHSPLISPDSIREQRDTLFRNMNLKLQEGSSQPYYAPETDTVCLPYEKDFFDCYGYACTMLHECGHATGHETRLNRDLSAAFGTEDYAKEELRAEIASAFAAQALGLQLTDQQLAAHMGLHKAYIQSWAKSIQDAPEELFKAIKDAEKISDYLIEKGEFQKIQEHTQTPETVGRIDYLATDGRVAESEFFDQPNELVKAVNHASDIGEPFSLILYDNVHGNTIPTDFLQGLSNPPCGIHVEHFSAGKEALLSVKAQAACAKRASEHTHRLRKPKALER